MRTWSEAANRILDKLLSGQFLVTVMMSITYCYLVSFIVTKLSDKVSGDFALGFVGGFSTSFMLIIQWYFDKDKQMDKENGNGKKINSDGGVVASGDPASPSGN